MHKIGICGFFDWNNTNPVNGQTIKTKNLQRALTEKFGSELIISQDSSEWKKRPFAFLKNCIDLAAHSEHVILLPAQRGVKIFVPLFYFLSLIFKNKVHYAIVGGWIEKMLEHNNFLLFFLKRIDFIYSETKTLQNSLKKQGLNNVHYLPNFKFYSSSDTLTKGTPSSDVAGRKVCILSRIVKEKGVSDAIEVVNLYNQNYEFPITLDIYGPVGENYEKELSSLLSQSSHVNYLGIIDSEKTSDVISKYNALLFPTLYYTEGLPGTIIDAYKAGIPVLASTWESAKDIVTDYKTGLLFDFGNKNVFYSKLIELFDLMEDPNKLDEIKKACLNKYQEFSPEQAISELLYNLEAD